MLTHNDICNAVKKAALNYKLNNAYYFGSYARGTQNDDSDLDLIVDFGIHPVILFYITGLAADLEDILHVEVDILKFPILKDTHIKIDKVVKCYGSK